MKSKIIYYENELTDDFSGFQRNRIDIDQSYPYMRGKLWSFFAHLFYRMVRIFAFFYMKIRFSVQFENRRALKLHKKDGYFIYANHTHIPADGFLPALICYPKRIKVLVCSENLSLKGTKNLMAMLGAVPIPTKLSGMRNYKAYLHHLIFLQEGIMIYPEAHVWPYYTKIRPFGEAAFTYPVIENTPVYSFTVTYHKKRIRTKMICYVDGPFYPKNNLSQKEASKALRNEVYEAMVRRRKKNTYEKIKYVKKERVGIC